MNSRLDSVDPATATANTTQVARLASSGVRIDVRCANPAPIRWLTEYFDVAEDRVPAPEHVIDLVIDPRSYESIHAAGPVGTPIDIDCFTLDGGFERHAQWSHEGGIRTIHHDRARLFLGIDLGRRLVSILAASDHRHTRVAALRVVRELVTARGLERGNLLVHAAAVGFEGRGVLLAGQKGSGKTSMLYNALARDGVGFLSNDRVMVHAEADGLKASGQPTIVRTRPESLRYLESPRDIDWARTYPYALTPEEADVIGDRAVSDARPCFSMSPAQFARWLGVERLRETRPCGLVFPRVDRAVDSYALKVLDSDTTAARLHDNLLAPTGTAEAFVGPECKSGSDAHERHDRCARVAKTCIGLECALGPRAFRSPNVWPAIQRIISGEG